MSLCTSVSVYTCGSPCTESLLAYLAGAEYHAAAGVPAVGAPDVPDVSATAIDPPIADIRAAIGALDVRAFSSSESIF